MKKLLTTILAIGLIASMTACGGKKNESKSSNETKGNETKQTTEINVNVPEPTEDGEVIINDLAGKTLAEAMDMGYDLVGYTGLGDYIELDLESEAIDSNVEKVKKSIEGMTVAEMVEKYDISIGYMGFNGEYTFLADVGSIEFSFDLENGVTAIEAHEDESFFDLETAEEIQNDKLENLKVECIYLVAELDDASCVKLNELDDYDSDIIEEMKDEIVLSKVYYTVE